MWRNAKCCMWVITICVLTVLVILLVILRLHKSRKVSSQCNKVVKEAYSILGVINRCFLNKTKDILVPLYKSLVRSRLEYCVQAWRPGA